MPMRVAELLSLYKFPVGRCLFALRAVEERALAVSAAAVAELAGRGVAEVEDILNAQVRYRAGADGLYPPHAVAADGLVDRCLGGIDGYLDVQMRMYPGEPRAQAAERLQQALLPHGVAAISRLPYAEEHSHVGALLARALAPGLAADVAALPEMAELLERLRVRNAEYGALLRSVPTTPTRAEIDAGRERSQELLAGTAALIIGLYVARGPQYDAERDHLLQPILKQNEALRKARRRRQAPVDIDPTTGEELGADPDGEQPEPAMDEAPDAALLAEQPAAE